MSVCNHEAIRALHPEDVCVLCHAEAPTPTPVAQLDIKDPRVRAAIRAEKKARDAGKARASFADFLRLGWHVLGERELEWSWHHQTLCNHFQWMVDQWRGDTPRECQNLLVNVPPGTLKSRILSVYGPAWVWLDSPSASFLCLSTNKDVALRDSMLSRDLIESEWYRDTFDIPWEISSDQDAKGLYQTTLRGIRKSQPANAKVVGFRGDFVIGDDPNDVKDTSELALERVRMSWLAARNRVNDPRRCVRIIVQQRVHENDLSGHLLRQGDWEHLCIPMEYTTAKCACGAENCDTTLGKHDPRTEDGEVLHPEIHTPEVLASEKRAMGSLQYAGQMNQRPSPEGGAIFQASWWRYYDELPKEVRGGKPGPWLVGPGVLSCDLTFGGRKRGTDEAKGTSRCAFLLVFPHKANRYIHYAWAGKLTYTQMRAKVQEIYHRFNDSPDCPPIGKVLVEAKAAGDPILDELGDVIPGLIPISPTGDKTARANTSTPIAESGNVRLLRDAPWVDEFVHELGAFPTGQYDDLLDVYSQAINYMHTPGVGRARALCAW